MKQHAATWFPAALVGFFILYLVYAMVQPKDRADDFRLHDFDQLPIVYNGRVMSLDTLARTSLIIISGKQSFKEEVKVDGKVETQTSPAIKWLLDTFLTPPPPPEDEDAMIRGPAAKHKVFRIENEEVLSLLGLEARPGFRYSLEEMWPRLREFYRLAHHARKVDAKKRQLVEAKALELANHLELYYKLASLQEPHALPPPEMGGDWQILSGGFRDLQSDIANAPAKYWADMLVAYVKNNTNRFNQALSKYEDHLQANLPSERSSAKFETFFNNFMPFIHIKYFYLFVFVLGCLSWLVWSEPLRKASLWLSILALLVHSWAMIARMYLQGRPPVTNLYSSAVFIGWGCLVLCIVLECVYRNSMGNVVGGITGFITLYIAHFLSFGGDTMEMLQAVLDTNFWLSTHVTSVTIGYTATFVAGFIGIVYIICGVFTPHLTRERVQTFSKMIYGVVCFAMIFSFIGTVLGGLWADFSWGRFWGWDPKENGALLIVIWNAIILHARWGGMIKQRGLAVLAVGGNIVTSWSWFGTNMLGVGLHSYGFMAGAVALLLAFDFFFVLVMAMGMLPLDVWVSFAPKTPSLPKPPAGAHYAKV